MEQPRSNSGAGESMSLSFQKARDRELCARLISRRPALQSAVRSSDSTVDGLLDDGLVDRQEYLQALATRDRTTPLVWGRFTVFEELGRGAMGVAYRAQLGDSPCALKVLRSLPADQIAQAEERFQREVEVLARLNHPGIVNLIDAGSRDGALFHATEFVAGGSLADVFTRARPVPARALDLARGCARALSHAHEQGVVHRDLKPENVLVGEDGRARLVDFGLAKDLWGETLTRSHAFLGTALFAAPEQLVWAKDCDPRADVYGLGAVLHFALTGSPPFPARSLGELYQKVSNGFVPFSDLPGLGGSAVGELNAVLGGALAADVAARPSMPAFLGELDRLGTWPDFTIAEQAS
jgi:serine/threonine protein kinase